MLKLRSFKGIQGRVIKPPKIDSDLEALSEQNITDLRRFLRYKLEYVHISKLTLNEKEFAESYLDSELDDLQRKYEAKNGLLSRWKKPIMYAVLLFALGWIYGALTNSDGGSPSNSIITEEDCVNYLNGRKIESYDDDYKTFYSDRTLGMAVSPLQLEIQGRKIKYENCTPASYVIKKHAGGNGHSRNPYFTLTFSPNCARGDDIVLYVYLDNDNRPDLLGISSKIFDSDEALSGSGDPRNRVLSDGPVLRKL